MRPESESSLEARDRTHIPLAVLGLTMAGVNSWFFFESAEHITPTCVDTMARSIVGASMGAFITLVAWKTPEQ